MRIIAMILGLMLTGVVAGWAQSDIGIESFDTSGQITFTKVTNAVAYRVEWSPTTDGPWTNFAAAAASLDSIVSPGLGVVTASVPMIYRVVATVANPPSMALIPAGSFGMGNATNVFPSSEAEATSCPSTR